MLKPMICMDFNHVENVKFCKLHEFCKELDMIFYIFGMVCHVLGMPFKVDKLLSLEAMRKLTPTKLLNC